jgi:hypothetical protein
MTTTPSFTALPDSDLLAAVRRLAAHEREATVALIASLAELDARKLYLAEGCSSLFTYCTHVLHLSEYAAYGRIEAARAARRFPVILERLAAGELTLTTIGLLASHLTPANYRDLIEAARHKSKRDVEYLVAALRPQPPVPSSVHKLPSPVSRPATRNAGQADQATWMATPSPPPMPLSVPAHRPPCAPMVVRPTAPERYRVQLTVDGGTFQKLRRVQNLM